MTTAKKIALLVKPIAEMTDAEVGYVVANGPALRALIGTPAHTAALKERSRADYAKKVAAEKARKEAAAHRRFRAKDNAAVQAYLRTFLPA